MALFKNRDRQLSYYLSYAIIVFVIIIFIIFIYQNFISNGEDKTDESINNDAFVQNTGNVQATTTSYSAVFEPEKKVNDSQLNIIKDIISQRIENFGMDGQVYVSDGSIAVNVNATKEQEIYLKYLGIIGKISMRTEKGNYIFDDTNVKSVDMKNYGIEGKSVTALCVYMNDDYIDDLSKITKKEEGNTFSFLLDDNLVLSASLGNKVNSGKMVIAGINEEYMQAIKTLYMSDRLPVSLKAVAGNKE